ncbi:hypothetical protein D9M70_436510 [compost metagenome]
MNHCALFGHTVGNAGDRSFGCITGRKRQHRELGADERHRPVQNFGRGIGFRMHAGGFLELQRRLAGDRKRRATAEHIERFRLAEIVGKGLPVELDGLRKLVRQIGDCPLKRCVTGPFAEHGKAGDDRIDVGLGGRNGDFRTGENVERVGAGFGDRRGQRVRQRDRDGAGIGRGLRHGDDIRALARLRNRDRRSTAELQFGAVDRGERRAERGDRSTGLQLDRIFQEKRGMIGGAAGDRDQEGRILDAECRAGGLELIGRAFQQALGGFGDLVDFSAHIGLHGQFLSAGGRFRIPTASVPRQSHRHRPGRASG